MEERKDGKTRKPLRGSLRNTCPVCQAAPGQSCVRYAHDDNGEPYIAERLRTSHAPRRHAT